MGKGLSGLLPSREEFKEYDRAGAFAARSIGSALGILPGGGAIMDVLCLLHGRKARL